MKHKKLLALAMAATMAIGTLSVGASTTTTQDLAANSTGTTEVSCSLGSTFTVKIPKTITVTVEKGAFTEAYNVAVQGDIAGTEVVKVVPDTTFNMKATGKTDVATAVTQTKTVFKHNEIVSENVAPGSIAATKLSAGAWSGNFNFNISLEAAPTTPEVPAA